jgi:hypothetical protein
VATPIIAGRPPRGTALAALWMTGWLAAMVTIAIAAREAGKSLHVFQIMEIRSLLGIVLFVPMIAAAGGVRAMRTGVSRSTSGATPCTMPRSSCGSRDHDDSDRGGRRDRVHRAGVGRGAGDAVLGERMSVHRAASIALASSA